MLYHKNKIEQLFIALSFTIVLNLGFSNSVNAQQHPVKIGDHLPRIELNNLINHKSPTIDLQSLAPRAVLLDFGATNCPPCIESLKNLNKLKQLFADKLEVFMVTYEKPDIVKKFLKKNPEITLPIIVQDTSLRNLFKHKYEPHIVWIGPDQVVRAYTDHSHVSYENIDSLIKGKLLNWPVKLDVEYDIEKALLTFNKDAFEITQTPKPVRFHSVIAENLKGGILPIRKEFVDTVNRTYTFRAINHSIIELYMAIQGQSWQYQFAPSYLISEKEIKSRLYYDPKFGYRATWMDSNTYSVEFTVPIDVSREKRMNMLKESLSNGFNIDVSFEKKHVRVWVVYVANQKRIKLNQKIKGGILYGDFIYAMNRSYPNPPTIDETSFNPELLDAIMLPVDVSSYNDLDRLKSQLEPYGLSIKEDIRELEICLVTERMR